MNYLQLAQAAKRESGLTGGGPPGFPTATGDDLRLFHWIEWAWRDIELMHESWLWRRASATGQTNGTTTMSPSAVAPGFALANFSRWLPAGDVYRPTTYKVSEGVVSERPLSFLRYDTFRMRFIVGSHTAAPLQNWTIAPNGDMLVGPTPDAAHIVRADYIKAHQELTSDADIPGMPADFHPLIYWYAVREYGGFDAASEVWQRCDRNFSSLFPALAQSQLPQMRWGA
jgi:hypothetical protein